MADVRAAWNETGDKLTELGRKLKVHYDDQHGGDSQQTREELADATRRLGVAVRDAFDAIGAAARDKAVKDDVKQVGQSLAEALGATLGLAAEELKRALSERKGPGPVAQTPPPAETTPTAAGATETQVGTEAPSAPEAPPAAEAPPAQEPPKETPPKVEPWGTP